MSYKIGMDVLGADISVFGRGGGHGGGRGHGGHGGHRRGRGFGRGGWYGGWGYPTSYGVACDAYGPNGECLMYVNTAQGLKLVPASLGPVDVLGDVGMDINAANKAVRGAKPMSVAQAHRFIELALTALAVAEQKDPNPGPGATARRVGLGKNLTTASSTIDSYKLDPLPETAAELLRNLVLQCIVEFNAVAEGQATLAAARSQFFKDVIDNAKGLSIETGNTLKWALWIGAGVAGLTAVGLAAHYIKKAL